MTHKYFLAVVIAAAFVGSAQAQSKTAFVDVNDQTKFGAAIEYIQEKGLVQGYADGSYRPTSTINRYDFTKIIVEARFDAETIAGCEVSQFSFPDVPQDQWFSPYVCTAKKNDIVNGYGDGTFGGQNHISLPEALKIVFETFEINTPIESGDTWYQPYMRAAATAEITNEIGNDLHYSITRGDMAELIVKTEAISEIKIGMSDKKDSETRDIVELAAATDDLSTLVAAVTAADLGATLGGEGPFTVFAPVNSAFAALPAGTLDDLLKPENKDDLTGILTFHVAAGAVMAADLSDGQEITTVNGAKVKVSIEEDGTVMIGDAKVITADIPAANGVVHLIDMVLIPATE